MEKFTVSSLPIKDVLADLSREMNTDYLENCSFYEINIPSRYGSGKITGIDFDDGLGLIRYDCKFKFDVTLEFSIDKIHPVKFIFCNEGTIDHNFTNESILHKIPQFKNAIVASSEHHGHVLRFYANERTLLSSLELDRRKFQQKISCELKLLGKQLRDLLNDVSAKKTFYHNGYYSLEISEVFKKWDLYNENGLIRKFYLEGLAYHILVLQINQYKDDTKSDSKKTLLRKSEQRQLKKVLNRIDENISSLPTIDALAMEVGLNPKKLQQGFRDIFSMSVNSYITKKRMEIARMLLVNTEMNLADIAVSIGYDSQSYFAKKFKKTFGVLPSQFRLMVNKQ